MRSFCKTEVTLVHVDVVVGRFEVFVIEVVDGDVITIFVVVGKFVVSSLLVGVVVVVAG
jgi:hypothetical protein